MAKDNRCNDESLLDRAETILSEKNYKKDCYPLRELVCSINFIEKNVSRKVKIFKWFGQGLLILIPIISALLTFTVAAKQETTLPWLKDSMPYLSLVLTLMTILNSIFRPGDRFKEACLLGIKI